jgi:hypothetical protein
MFPMPMFLRSTVIAISAACLSLAGATPTRAASATIDGWHQIRFGMNKAQVLAALPEARLYHNLCEPLDRRGLDCELVRGHVDMEGFPFVILVYFGKTDGRTVGIALSAEHPTSELYQHVLALLPLSQGILTTRKRHDQTDNLFPSGGSCAEVEASFSSGHHVSDGKWIQRTYLGDAVTLQLDGGLIAVEYSKNGLCPQTPAIVRSALEPAYSDFVNDVELELEYLAPGQSPFFR